MSIRSEEIQAGKTARYNVTFEWLNTTDERVHAFFSLGRFSGSEKIAYWSIISSNESDERITTVERSET